MDADLQTWAMPRLARLLPIDDESLKEILNYSLTLTKEAGAEHLKNLLGDSEQAFELISGFNSRRSDATATKSTSLMSNATPDHTDSDTGVPRRKAAKKTRAPLHKAGPVRQPEGYGNVAGGYQKSYVRDNHAPGSSRTAPSATALSDALLLSQEPVALQVPKAIIGPMTASSGTSRDVSPAPGRHKLPPSAAGNLISDLPNVRSKQLKKPSHATHSGSSTPRSINATATTTNLTDLTSAIAALEIATNPSMSSERRRCDCNTSIHPLFETAPNCTSCGKIICAFEGLQPCSYCNAPILTKDQVVSMIRALKEERGVERMANHNAGVASGRGTPMFASTPESSGDEGSNAAARARAHRDKLLAFQRDNAQRTRVHDEAADYDLTLTPGATQWMSPMQRAAALKKQQKYLREVQEASRPEWEKKKTVMSMSIKNGKLVRTYQRQNAPSIEVDAGGDHEEEIPTDGGDQQQLSAGGGGAFSNNPLLASGKLVRPIWKGKNADPLPLQESTRDRKSVWRKVQDDNENNEQWILDGGLRGYGTETRQMEDGSQQECG